MSIFVHRASELLTDHESFGDGLICFSLLNGLAERGHHICAYANHAAIDVLHPNLQVRAQRHRSPANSLAPWEHAWRADRWLRQLLEHRSIDIVWRMHPYDQGCPVPPLTLDRPLVVGPMFYSWPQTDTSSSQGTPRLGIGLQRILRPIAKRGWKRTLQQASLLICATEAHAAATRALYPAAETLHLPLIVDAPTDRPSVKLPSAQPGDVRLIFVANLVASKNPLIFCETVARLRANDINATATVVGDGPERGALENYCRSAGVGASIRFLGKIPNREVWDHLEQAHFLVSCSLGEPYGRSIAEAMAVGCPPVCHRSGGPADFILHGTNGLVVEALNAAAYATAIEDVIRQGGTGATRWGELSRQAAATASQWRSEILLPKLEAALWALVAEQPSTRKATTARPRPGLGVP